MFSQGALDEIWPRSDYSRVRLDLYHDPERSSVESRRTYSGAQRLG
jgi:hypothetical protein